MFKSIISCASLRSLPMGIASVIMGSALAVFRGYGDILVALFCLIFACLVQAFANMSACYAKAKREIDVRKLDMLTADNAIGLPPREMLSEACKFLSILIAFITIALFLAGGWLVLVGMAIIAVFIYINNFSKRQLGRTPTGTLTAFICFGPVATLGTFLMQVQHTKGGHLFPLPPIPVAITCCIVMGLYAVLVLLAYNYTTYEYDMQQNSTTTATVLGKNTTRWIVLATSVVIYLIQMLVPFCLKNIPHPIPYPGWVVAVVTISFIINLEVFFKLSSYVPSEGRIIQNIAMANALFYAVGMYVILMIAGFNLDADLKIYF